MTNSEAPVVQPQAELAPELQELAVKLAKVLNFEPPEQLEAFWKMVRSNTRAGISVDYYLNCLVGYNYDKGRGAALIEHRRLKTEEFQEAWAKKRSLLSSD